MVAVVSVLYVCIEEKLNVLFEGSETSRLALVPLWHYQLMKTRTAELPFIFMTKKTLKFKMIYLQWASGIGVKSTEHMQLRAIQNVPEIKLAALLVLWRCSWLCLPPLGMGVVPGAAG